VPGQNFWWVAPTYAVAGIAFDRLKRWLKDSGTCPPSCYTVREAEQAIDVAGRTIWFKGADKPDSLYGEDVYAAVFDEASRAKPDAWYALRSTLTATRGPVKIIGNVRGRKNWAYTLARRAESGAKGYAYFKLTAWDAVEGGVLDARGEVEDAKATLPRDVFKELYLAEPSDDGGNPFGLTPSAQCPPRARPSPRRWCYGVDLAKSRLDRGVRAERGRRRVPLLERWQATGDRPERASSTSSAARRRWWTRPAWATRSWKRCSRNGATTSKGFKFTGPSKQQLMEGLADRHPARRHHLSRRLAGRMSWKPSSTSTPAPACGTRHPKGLHDDGVCALASATASPSAALATPASWTGCPR
jgi:hypothetical protein